MFVFCLLFSWDNEEEHGLVMKMKKLEDALGNTSKFSSKHLSHYFSTCSPIFEFFEKKTFQNLFF